MKSENRMPNIFANKGLFGASLLLLNYLSNWQARSSSMLISLQGQFGKPPHPPYSFEQRSEWPAQVTRQEKLGGYSTVFSGVKYKG